MIFEPPIMLPCRAEMRDVACAGLTEDCGAPVALACPRCGHERNAHAHHCAAECMVVMAGHEDARPGGYCPCPGYTTPTRKEARE